MSRYDDLKQQADAAIGRYHQTTRDCASTIVTANHGDKLRVLTHINAQLRSLGINIQIEPFHTIQTNQIVTKFLVQNDHTAEWHYDLQPTEQQAVDAANAEAHGHWQESERLRRLADAALDDEREELPTYTTKDEFIKVVSADPDEQEEYYAANGPRKHEQEDYTGVQVVAMNVGLLNDWLSDICDGFDDLGRADQRAVWEASGFHFGINGYDATDADHYWAN